MRYSFSEIYVIQLPINRIILHPENPHNFKKEASINIIKLFFGSIVSSKIFPSQSLQRFTFRVKLSDSIFFLLGLSHIVKLI